MDRKNIFLIIIGGILLTFLLFLPGLTAVKKCPLGLVNDTFPGRCPLYQDTQQKGVCDLSQSESLINFSLPKKPLVRDFFQPEIWFVTGLLGIGSALVFWRRFFYLRYLFLALSIFYLGFFIWFSICPLRTWQLLFLLKGGIVSGLAPFLIFLIPIFVVLIFGALFCGWVCPLGGIQEFWWRIGRKIKPLYLAQNYFRRFNLGRFSFLKYLFLILIILAVVLWKRPILCGLDPFGAIFGYFKNPAVWVSLIVFAVLALAIFRPFCRFFCPYGALLSLLSKISIFQLKTEKEKCQKCNLCQKVCLIEAINKNNQINQGECIRCGECLVKCPVKAIQLKLNK